MNFTPLLRSAPFMPAVPPAPTVIVYVCVGTAPAVPVSRPPAPPPPVGPAALYPPLPPPATANQRVLYGVAELLEPLAELVPTLLVAVTVNVYAVPVVKPDTVIGELAPVPVTPPGEDVTVYTVIGLPPSLAGGVKVIKALAMPAVAVPILWGHLALKLGLIQV